MSTKKFERLPLNVVPLHYDLWLKPDLTQFTFLGTISTCLEVKEETQRIVCNAADMEILDLNLVTSSGDQIPVGSFSTDEKEELLKIELGSKLPVGKATLKCNYKGTLNDKMKGFYRSKYTQEGEDRYAAVTQLEAADARRCFPCWDEPALKATFSLTVTAPKDRIVLSNMPQISEETDPDNGGNKIVRFDTSPKMSTYLVAVVVGEFEHVECQSKEGILVRVFTPLGKKDQGKFALDACSKAITFYKDFFGISYPLPKYDCIAISDFECGAMENWGLVTFRETAVLVDPKLTSADSKQWIAIVVTHEMAHQWFGNLVTMEWWTHLWLNEGFASFMEHFCTHDLFPEYDIWTQFVTDTLIPAFQLDALDNSHPIEVPVGAPSEVDEIFDNISYNKGASVIRMLYWYIGDAAFRSGMKSYLTKYSYKNAETPDLWASLEEASGKPVGKIMSTWTSQMGFPLISVQCQQEDGVKTLKLSQEKFNADGSKSSGYLWCVPISIITSSGARKEVLLETDSMTVTLENSPAGEWFKLNPEFVGFYRVHYPPEVLAVLRPAIENNSLTQVDRLQLLNDTFALALAGKASTVDFLSLLLAYKYDKSYVVWCSICSSLSKIQNLVSETDYYQEFKDYSLDLMSEILKTVGWEKVADEPHTNGLLRSLIIMKMGAMGHEETLAEARKRFGDHLSGNAQIPADLRASVYRAVMANGDLDTLAQMQKLFRAADLHEEKERLSRSMGSCQKKEVLEQVLEFSLGGEIRAQDIPFVIASVGANSKGRDLAWNFLKAKYNDFLSRYKSGMLMNNLIKYTTEYFVSLDKASEIENFFKENKNPADRVVKQSIETIRLNAAWLDRDGEKIQKFLQSRRR